jgi:hypothetical protein
MKSFPGDLRKVGFSLKFKSEKPSIVFSLFWNNVSLFFCVLFLNAYVDVFFVKSFILLTLEDIRILHVFKKF